MTLFDEVKLSHYQILGVEKTADDEEIKRAYFSMVRKFQPGSFPEKFKEIRIAYETLRDKQKRAEYDAIGELPDSMAPLFHEAQWFDHLGRYNKAAELYKMILKRYPELDNVREQYANSLAGDDKTGKAAEVWEELCQRNPGNVHYARELGASYYYRGWYKKGIAEMRRAIALDSLSLDTWSLLTSCTVEKFRNVSDGEPVLEELKTLVHDAINTVKAVKENEWKKIILYSHAFVLSYDENRGAARVYLKEIIRLIREGGGEGQKEGMKAFVSIFEGVPNHVLGLYFNEIQEMADLLPELTAERGHDSSLKTKPNSFRVRIEQIRMNYEIENLEKKGFSKIFYDLFRILTADFAADDGEIEIAAIEYHILDDKSTYDPQLRRLKEEFPELYALHSSFFNEALRTQDPEKMLYQRGKKINKYRRDTGFFDDHPESAPEQPVRRAEPKIGRNDPCPCGSGKKYKKCCGA